MALPLLFAVSTLAGGCQTLQSETIQAHDVAAVVPDYARVPEDFRLGYLPSSGAPRILLGADLQRIAKNQGIELQGLPDVCFARWASIPTPGDIAAAMRKALSDLPGISGAKIEVVSSSQHPAPFGELIFPRAGLQLPAAGQTEALWRGYVRQASSMDFPVWARVRIIASTTRVVAIANIPSGTPIQKTQVTVESCEDSILDETAARSLDDVLGYLPKTLLREYLPIRKSQLSPPPDVAKGELVNVEVYSGAAHLMVKGKAQSDGFQGSTILIRNITSGKDFRAQVARKGLVIVGDSVP